MKPLHFLPNLKLHLFHFFLQYWTSRNVVHLSYGPKIKLMKATKPLRRQAVKQAVI